MSTPPADMPPRFIKRAFNQKLLSKLELARQKPGLVRQSAERSAWQDDEARGTRYGKRATLSQQKRRKAMRRARPHGWKGGMAA